ncbi:hypothetical protein [Pontitalea aquivivens]|uniref:hypothetical protein n=1 Tax=Pontitalea aquivivens TaxID=3388663 RepID=UPI003970B68F
MSKIVNLTRESTAEAAPATKVPEETLAYYRPEARPAPAPESLTALDQMYGYYTAA